MELKPESRIVPHLFVNALERSAGWTARTRFANAITSMLLGEQPVERWRAAGLACQRDGVSPGAIEASVMDWFETDLNPEWLLVQSASSLHDVVSLFNGVMESSMEAMGIQLPRWIFKVSESGEGLDARRLSPRRFEHPEACQIVSLANANAIARTVLSKAASGDKARERNVSAVAAWLGVERSAAGEVARVLETEGRMSVASIAKALGCHQRTLQRQLEEEGLTAEAIRQACMLVWATNRLREDSTLTEIAMDAGYFDLSHMNRAFRTACGLTPSALRRSAIDAAGSAGAAVAGGGG